MVLLRTDIVPVFPPSVGDSVPTCAVVATELLRESLALTEPESLEPSTNSMASIRVSDDDKLELMLYSA